MGVFVLEGVWVRRGYVVDVIDLLVFDKWLFDVLVIVLGYLWEVVMVLVV